MPFAADDGKTHLVTELLITNTGKVPLQITRIEVQDGSNSKPVLMLSGEQVVKNMTAVNVPVDTSILAAGQAGLVYLNVSMDSSMIPDTLIHKVSADNKTKIITATGAKIAVDKKTIPPIIGSPVAGGTWVAAEACCYKSHHRRSPFNLNGAYFLSQRYAIDFMKMVDGKLWMGDNPKDLTAWYTYQQDALAPADSTIVSVLDNELDVTPFEKNPKEITMDNVTGNHLIFDLGNDIFVVYAHLKPGSILVKKGDKVHKGQKVALVGNSGNTDAPAPTCSCDGCPEGHSVQRSIYRFIVNSWYLYTFCRGRRLGLGEHKTNTIPGTFSPSPAGEGKGEEIIKTVVILRVATVADF